MAKLRETMGMGGDRNRRTYLTADMFKGEVGGGVVAVLSVEQAEVVDVGGRKEVLVTFSEYPENPMWTNRTSLGFLIDGAGTDDTDEWPGLRVPLVKVHTENPTTKEKTTRLYPVAPVRPDTWGEVIAGFEGAQGPNTGGARKPRAKGKDEAATSGDPATTDADGKPLKF